MKIVDAETMARIDARSTAEYGIASADLMEAAGLQGYLRMKEAVWDGSPHGNLVFVAGRGANGGDALVMARHAHLDGANAAIVLASAKPPGGTDAAVNLASCEALGIPCTSWPDTPGPVERLIASVAWVFDGIAGTGLRGPLRSPLDALVAALNASPGHRVAIDVPSGLGDGYRGFWPVVHADCTLAMGLPKACLYLPRARRHCGRILVVQPGFPAPLLEDPAIRCELIDDRSFRGLLGPLPVDAHKGDRGHLAVFAGAPGTTGAAWLAAHAAARARVGLVSLFLDAATLPLVAPACRSVMAKPWGDADPRSFDPSRYTALLVGPGWGLGEGRERWLDFLLAAGPPGVLDADGITLFAGLGRKARSRLGGRWVLTPHPGEFARLAGIPKDELLDDPIPRALAAARELDAVVVLKGHVTIVADPSGSSRVLDGCNPALGTAGSGDVLAGLVAAGLAGGLPPAEAAVFGVSLHARLGAVARQRVGWFIAEDLVPFVSGVLGEVCP
ncbi:MAG: NAD(P)H-hydrate dehydratase [Spirochaetes bacterium]|nr:NAD(P)H-hydrate dehydratase [Spirochaetota bacterium]